MKPAVWALSALIVIFISACDKKESGPNTAVDEIRPEAKDTINKTKGAAIHVVDDQGHDLTTARLLLGSATSVDNPWLLPDATGHFEIPITWISATDLTIDAPGFVRLTLKDQKPVPLNLAMKKRSQLPQLSIKGTTTGINTKDKDGYIDFAIALDSLKKSDVLNFNISKVISPWTEKVSVLGFEFPVPQNIFLPKQKETYFFTVTLQKAWFNLFYDTYGIKSLYALRGKFPMKKVISELQNKTAYFELINFFEMSSAGRMNYNFTSATSTPSIDANQIPLDKTYTLKAPPVDASQVIFGISAFKENGFYQPVDIKYMKSQETMTFKTFQTATPYFIGVLKNKTEFAGDSAVIERMSVSIDSPKQTVNYLPLIKDPHWASANELQLELPPLVDSGITEQGLVVVVSELQNLSLPDGQILKYKLPLWEIHCPRWSSSVQLPELDVASKIQKRVEVTLLAREADNSGQQNPVTLISSHEERIEAATHLTKSALDY